MNLHHSEFDTDADADIISSTVNDSSSSSRDVLSSAYFKVLQQYLLAQTNSDSRSSGGSSSSSSSNSGVDFHSPHDRHTNASSSEGGDKGLLSPKAKRMFTALR